MGKNQAYKAMQRAKMATQSAAGGVEDAEDGMMDGSFHSPEWHAARLASLQTSHTITWEEYKRRQKDEAKRKEEEEDDEVRLMKDYRAQLDAERARKLARGSNHVDKKLPSKGKKDKDKDKKRKKSKKKRKHASESDSESDLSTDDEKHRSRRKEREKFKRDKKERGHKSRRKACGSASETSSDEEYGPLPLSSYFEGSKS